MRRMQTSPTSAHRYRRHLDLAPVTAFEEELAAHDRAALLAAAERLRELAASLTGLAVDVEECPTGRMERLGLRHRMEAISVELDEMAKYGGI